MAGQDGGGNRAEILREGRNYWRRAMARRAAFLVDGAAYYGALRTAALKAERSITILGWDIHSRMKLVGAEPPQDGLPEELGPFLNALIDRRRRLVVRILAWDFAMIYAVEREVLPLLNPNWTRHRRLLFRLDSTHPLGASHHQKIVLIDDKLAFAGGIDLTMRRWDTSEHRAVEPRRRDPDGVPYAPFHDVQMVVDGEAARALADLAAERWRRATHRRLRMPRTAGDPWPKALRADLVDAEIAIARTQPAWNGKPERHEIQHLWEDAIRAARCSIYIEQQYFTAANVADALVRRLGESEGPDVVIVLPKGAHGWLEQAALADQQARTIRRLRAADHHGRLRFFYPVVPGDAPEDQRWVRVHSKVLIVDDGFVRVGSSNTSNRSMGVDTECDLAVECNRPALCAATAAFRDRLLGEHLGRAPLEVAAAIRAADGSLAAAIDALGHKDGRGFARVDDELPEDPLRLHEEGIAERNVFDPERPIEPERFLDDFMPEAPSPDRLSRRIATSFGYVAIMVALLGGWVFTPLQEIVTADLVLREFEDWRRSFLTPLLVVAAFSLGGLTLLPVTLLIISCGVVFGPVLGPLYALLGVFVGATSSFFAGRRAGRDLVRRLAGRRLQKISSRLARSGIVAVAILRLLPIAPFTLVNMVAGAMHLRYRDYIVGTMLGMLPGLVALTFLGVSIERILRGGDWAGVALLFIALAAIAAVGWAIQRWLRRPVREVAAGD
jgi:phospholipase D1/2